MAREIFPARFRRVLPVSALILASAAGWCAAQEGQLPAEAVQPRPSLRQAIEDRLADTRRQEERLQRALEMLDSGEAEEKIAEFLQNRGERRPGEWGRQWRGGPNRPGEDGPAGGDFPPGPLTPEQRERVLAFLRENLPAMWDKVQEARDPQMGDRIAQRMAPRVLGAIEAAGRDEELGRLKREEIVNGFGVLESIGQLRGAWSARQSDPGRFSAAAERVRRALAEQYDLRTAISAREITLLEARLAGLRAELAERESARDQEVGAEFDRVMGHMERPGRFRGRGGQEPGGGEMPPP